LALPNARNLLFGEGLLTRLTLSSRALNGDLFKPFGATNEDALRLVSPFPLMKIDMRLNGIVLEHSKKCREFKR
jgi:hypothetical protein